MRRRAALLMVLSALGCDAEPEPEPRREAPQLEPPVQPSPPPQLEPPAAPEQRRPNGEQDIALAGGDGEPAPAPSPSPAGEEPPSQLRPDVPGSGMPISEPDPRAKVMLGKPLVGAGLEPAIVSRVVRSHLGELRSCYEASLREQPQLAGDMTLVFDVDGEGKVVGAKIRGTTEAALARCLARAATRWRLPKPTGEGLTVEQPLTLVPSPM